MMGQRNDDEYIRASPVDDRIGETVQAYTPQGTAEGSAGVWMPLDERYSSFNFFKKRFTESSNA
jgi:hypothetical protein